MKMLFFSANEGEVLQMAKSFEQAGIPCEVRHPRFRHKLASDPAQVELWIKEDRDCHRGFLLCVRLGVGFAKRTHAANVLDLDDEPQEEVAPEQSLLCRH